MRVSEKVADRKDFIGQLNVHLTILRRNGQVSKRAPPADFTASNSLFHQPKSTFCGVVNRQRDIQFEEGEKVVGTVFTDGMLTKNACFV